MKINAIETKNVTVDVEPIECLKALAQHFKCSAPIFKHTVSEYYEEIRDTKGKLIALQRMEDISHHGTPLFQKSGVPIDDPATLRAYELLSELKSLI